MFDKIRITGSFNGRMEAIYRYDKELLVLYLDNRKKDFIEGVVHELIEQTINIIITEIFGNNKLINSSITFSSEYNPTCIEHIITVYSYPYKTIENQFSLLDKLFEKPEKPKELWK